MVVVINNGYDDNVMNVVGCCLCVSRNWCGTLYSRWTVQVRDDPWTSNV